MSVYETIYGLLEVSGVKELAREKEEKRRKFVGLFPHPHVPINETEIGKIQRDFGVELYPKDKKDFWEFENFKYFIEDGGLCTIVSIEYVYDVTHSSGKRTQLAEVIEVLMKKLVMCGVLVVCEKTGNIGPIEGEIRRRGLAVMRKIEKDNDVFLLIKKLPQDVLDMLPR